MLFDFPGRRRAGSWKVARYPYFLGYPEREYGIQAMCMLLGFLLGNLSSHLRLAGSRGERPWPSEF
jgi:hypothetical protein